MKLVVVLLVLCLSLASLAGCGVSKGKYEALLNEKVILEEKVGILATARDALKGEYDNLLKEKMDLAAQMMETSFLPTDWIYDKLFQFSEEEFDEYRDLVIEDKKRQFRMTQIQEEGNDPAESGAAYGTPHQIASMYGGYGTAPLSSENVPQGYNEKNPNEPTKLPGRPESKVSLINTAEDPLGRDRLGVYDLKSKPQTGESGNSLKNKFHGGSPLSLKENHSVTTSAYLKNKESLQKMFPNRRVNLFENESDLLNEDRIKPDSDLI